MDLYVIAAIGLVVLLFLLLTMPLSSKNYRCSACGFETSSELEAAGHEKLENTHKVIRS
jgi:hypothetical protein